MAEEQQLEYAAPVEGEGAVVRIGKRDFIGNLAWKTSWQDLKDKFRECGNVVYANVMRDEDGELAAAFGCVGFIRTFPMAERMI